MTLTGRAKSVVVSIARKTVRLLENSGQFFQSISETFRRRFFCHLQVVCGDGNSQERRFRLQRRLDRLELVGLTIPSTFLEKIASKRNLRELLFKDVNVTNGKGSLNFLRKLKRLEDLFIDNCPDLLTNGKLSPLTYLSKLKRLTLRIHLSHLDPPGLIALAFGGAVLRLTLYGEPSSHDLNNLQWMATARNLEELTFDSFGQSEFPRWTVQLSNLRILTFERGSLHGREMEDVALAPSLRSLILNCQMEYPLYQDLQTAHRRVPPVDVSLPEFL